MRPLAGGCVQGPCRLDFTMQLRYPSVWMSGKHSKPPAKSRNPSAALVKVGREHVVGPDGRAFTKLMIRMDDADIPSRQFTADRGWLHRDGDTTWLLFGQAGPFGDRIQSVIRINLSPEAVHMFIESCSEFLPTVRGFCDRFRVAQVGLDAPKEGPGANAGLAVMTANIIQAAQNARESVMDFYLLDAVAVRAAARRDVEPEQTSVEPVVRVLLPTGLMLPLLEAMLVMKDSLPGVPHE